MIHLEREQEGTQDWAKDISGIWINKSSKIMASILSSLAQESVSASNVRGILNIEGLKSNTSLKKVSINRLAKGTKKSCYHFGKIAVHRWDYSWIKILSKQ